MPHIQTQIAECRHGKNRHTRRSRCRVRRGRETPARPPTPSLRHPLQHKPIEAGGEGRGVLRQFAVEDLSLLQQ